MQNVQAEPEAVHRYSERRSRDIAKGITPTENRSIEIFNRLYLTLYFFLPFALCAVLEHCPNFQFG